MIICCGGSGGGGGSGGDMSKNGDAGQPGEVFRSAEQLMSNLQSGKLTIEQSLAAERATYRASKDAYFKEKDYKKAGELEKKYKVMQEVNHKYKVEQEAKAIDWSKGKWSAGGPSVRDDDSAGGRRDLTSSFAKRMKNPKFR